MTPNSTPAPGVPPSSTLAPPTSEIGDSGGAVPPQPQQPFSLSVFAPALSPSGSGQQSPTTAGSPSLLGNAKREEPDPDESKIGHELKQDKMPVKPRKKGMAVKKPASSRRKPKSGSAKKSPADAAKTGPSIGKKPTTRGDDEQTLDVDGEAGEAGRSGEESQDNGPYCICRGPDDHRWMIGCEICDDWFHGECVGLTKETGEMLVERFICPNCTDTESGIQTIYKRMCAFTGCRKRARMYGNYYSGNMDLDDDEPEVKREDTEEDEIRGSLFCSDDHRDLFWEHIIASLPKEKKDPFQDELTQQEVLSLLSGRCGDLDKSFPFVGDPFDPKRAPNAPLTLEEQDYIIQSETERREMGEEISILKKMHRLLELCAKRRTAAITAGRLEKDMCGYDVRLDFVGEPDSFRSFAQTPDIEVLFRPSTTAVLGPPMPLPEELAETVIGYHKIDFSGTGGGLYGTDDAVGGMCDKKRCRPHAGWLNIHARSVKYTITRLAEEAAAKLEEERQIKDHAAVRFLRRSHEKNQVNVLEGDGIFRNRPPSGLMIDAMTGEKAEY